MFGWYSLVAPAGTPDAVLIKASAEMVKAVKEPEFVEQLKTLGIDMVGGLRAELDAFRNDERKRITELVKAGGVDVK
jgi:tripartite-type tricarboxylate transporter receptor subunit TctC